MKGSIITGGLLGMALGAVAVFVLAKGLPTTSEATDEARPRAGQLGPTMVEEGAETPGSAPFRPLRPGSDRVGPRLQS